MSSLWTGGVPPEALQLSKAFEGLPNYTYELLFVDNSSTDGTVAEDATPFDAAAGEPDDEESSRFAVGAPSRCCAARTGVPGVSLRETGRSGRDPARWDAALPDGEAPAELAAFWPAESPVSASANAGIEAIATPTPRATARAPTRPT